MIGGGVVSPAARATAISVLLVIVSLVGNGIGPPFVGAMSDMFMNGQIAALGGDGLSATLCKAGGELTVAQGEICAAAYSGGLRLSMAATALFFIPAALGYYMAARTLGRDYHAQPHH